MPIYLSAPNVPVTIREITGTDKIRGHLQNLGFIVGETITLINKVDDNVIIKVKGVSLAISRELAKRIII